MNISKEQCKISIMVLEEMTDIMRAQGASDSVISGILKAIDWWYLVEVKLMTGEINGR